MTINITITAESAEHAQMEMRALLNGEGRDNGPVTGDVVTDTAKPTAPIKPVSGRTREKQAKEAIAAQQAISTGEERVDPEADKQDAKDEAAETAKEKAADPVKLTHDDVKKMLGVYVQLYGMEAAQADGEGFIGCKKISEIPDTQAALAAAVLGIAGGIEKNPKSRDVAGELDPEKLAALKPVVAAAKAVK